VDLLWCLRRASLSFTFVTYQTGSFRVMYNDSIHAFYYLVLLLSVCMPLVHLCLFSASCCYACMSDVMRHPKAGAYSGGLSEDCYSRGRFCYAGPDVDLGCTHEEVSTMISWQVVLVFVLLLHSLLIACLYSWKLRRPL
jgi:hypothetical protein